MPEVGARFAELVTRLKGMSTGGATAVVRAISREALTQAQACFRASRNPYGEPWAPLKHRKGKPLLDTGRGRGSLAVSDVSPTGFRIGTNVRYMAVHQDGYSGTVTRKPSARTQPTTASGRFLSRKDAGKKRQGALYNATRFTRLNFKGGPIRLVIPQRAFLPLRGRGLGLWEPAFTRAGLAAMARLARKA